MPFPRPTLSDLLQTQPNCNRFSSYFIPDCHCLIYSFLIILCLFPNTSCFLMPRVLEEACTLLCSRMSLVFGKCIFSCWFDLLGLFFSGIQQGLREPAFAGVYCLSVQEGLFLFHLRFESMVQLFLYFSLSENEISCQDTEGGQPAFWPPYVCTQLLPFCKQVYLTFGITAALRAAPRLGFQSLQHHRLPFVLPMKGSFHSSTGHMPIVATWGWAAHFWPQGSPKPCPSVSMSLTLILHSKALRSGQDESSLRPEEHVTF